MKNNTLFVFNAEANKKRVNNNTLFVYDAEANMKNAGTTKMQGSTQKWDKSGETSPILIHIR